MNARTEKEGEFARDTRSERSRGFLAALGDGPPGSQTTLALLAYVFILASLAKHHFTIGSVFSPDSFALYALSQTVFSDFYRATFFYSYFDPDYSAAFPPLWPFLIAVLDRVTGLGLTGAVYLNIVIVVASALVLSAALARIGAPSALGPLAVLVLCLNPGYLEEVFAARSIPSALFLFCLFLFLLVRVERMGGSCLAGLCLGAMVMARFDALLWIGILAPYVAWRTRSVSRPFVFCVGFVAALLPWIVHSLVRFGGVFVTNNSWVAKSAARDAYVTDFPARAAQTLFDAPLDWILVVLGRLPDLAIAVATSPGPFGLVALCTILSLALAGAGAPRQSRRGDDATPVLVCLLAFATSFPSYLATGYFDARYFAGLYFAVAILLVCRLGVARHAWLATLVVGALALAAPSPRERPLPSLVLDETCLAAAGAYDVVLVDPPIAAAHLGATTGLRTALVPRNLERRAPDDPDLVGFLETHGIEAMLDFDTRLAGVRAAFPLRAPDCPVLWTRPAP